MRRTASVMCRQLAAAACVHRSSQAYQLRPVPSNVFVILMVRIIDGEIVQDDDPRLQAARRPAAAPAAGAAGRQPPGIPAGGGNRPLFDFSAPPFRLVPDDGGGLGGLPNVLLFGTLVRSQHLLMLAGAGMFMGWRGLLVGSILWYVWASNNGGQAQQQQQQQGRQGDQNQRMAAAQNYFSQMMQQAPLGRGSSAAGGGNSGSAAGRSPSASQDPWASRGKAHKLSDS